MYHDKAIVLKQLILHMYVCTYVRSLETLPVFSNKSAVINSSLHGDLINTKVCSDCFIQKNFCQAILHDGSITNICDKCWIA